ncbi:putative prophage phiRv2 integrase [mine drainage metagenome]|uniref:Putative prophage phiRv2 integrase n=1 Tax=mine drainage metagenome TaxID=410659 RepID=A0A1J5S2U9_9ZZZZ
MPVRKRGDRWHVRLQIGGQRIERSLGPSATKADALDYEARIRRDLIAGKTGKTKPRTIEDALVRWLQGEAATLKSYGNLLSKVRALQPFAAGRKLEAIVTVSEEVKAAGIKDGLSPATINRRLAILRRLANLAHQQWGWLDQPLGSRIKLLRGERARHVYLTPDQVETLADHCEHPGVALAIRLVARTGMRETELLRADTIFDGCIVIEESKNGRPRLVPVPADMPGLTLPIGITYATLRTFFERARSAAGMPHVRFHDLRHTAASWWAQAGANLAVIRDLLGHANLAVTSRYAHLMTADLKRVSESMAKKENKPA